MKIEWKWVSGYEGLYEVSNSGVARSVGRMVKRRGGKYHTVNGAKLSPFTLPAGYKYIKLCKGGTTKGFSIHRLVAMAFIPNPDNKPQVNHINGKRDDNRIENLEWVTVSENHLHAYRELGRSPSRPMLGKLGSKNHGSKEVIQSSTDGCEIARFGSIREAGRSGFNSVGVSHCCTGRQKTHAGFVWNYA